jgi:hypothetical protein
MPGGAPSFSPLMAEGDGWVATVDFEGAQGVFTLGTTPSLGVEETLAAGRLTVFPNPTDGQWNLRVGGFDPSGARVRVVDAAGREVAQFPWQGGTTAPGVDLAPGWYLVVLEKAGASLPTSLIVR